MKRLLSTALRPYGAVILAMFCFALSFVWFKQAIVTYGPLTIVLFRMGLSSVVLLVFTHLTNRLRLPTRRDFRSLLLLAFFEPFVYFMCESYGLRLLSSTVGAVIVATIPLVAPIAGYLFYRERMTWRHLLGIAVSFGGVTLVVYEVGVGFTASPLGVLLEFGAVLAAVAYTRGVAPYLGSSQQPLDHLLSEHPGLCLFFALLARHRGPYHLEHSLRSSCHGGHCQALSLRLDPGLYLLYLQRASPGHYQGQHVRQHGPGVHCCLCLFHSRRSPDPYQGDRYCHRHCRSFRGPTQGRQDRTGARSHSPDLVRRGL